MVKLALRVACNWFKHENAKATLYAQMLAANDKQKTTALRRLLPYYAPYNKHLNIHKKWKSIITSKKEILQKWQEIITSQEENYHNKENQD